MFYHIETLLPKFRNQSIIVLGIIGILLFSNVGMGFAMAKDTQKKTQVKTASYVAEIPPTVTEYTETNVDKAVESLKIIKAPSVKGMDEKKAIEKLTKANVEKEKINVEKKKMTYPELVKFSETTFFGEVDQQKASSEEITLIVPEADMEDPFTVQMLEMGSRLAWPVPGYETLSSHFGHRKSPGGIGSTNHQGIDVPAPTGTPIIAVKEGKVERSSRFGGYGNCVVIDHGNGYKSLYGHMSTITCNVGDEVEPGDIIGRVGSTGWSTGAHLHFGLMKNDEFIDPEPFFTGKENVEAKDEVSENIQSQEDQIVTEPEKEQVTTKKEDPIEEKKAEEKETEKPKTETKKTETQKTETKKAPSSTKQTKPTQATKPTETKPPNDKPSTTQPTTKPPQTISTEPPQQNNVEESTKEETEE